MNIAIVISLIVVIAVVVAARRRGPSVTEIDRTIVRKDGTDA